MRTHAGLQAPSRCLRTPHASPLAQRARKAETGPDTVLKLAQRTQRTAATRTAAGLPAPGRASGVQTATPETALLAALARVVRL